MTIQPTQQDENNGNSTRPEFTLYNPLNLSIQDQVELTFGDPAIYEITQIATYATIHHTGRVFHAARYFLRDIGEDDDESDLLVLEVQEPPQGGNPQQFVFFIAEAFEYDDTFVEFLEDDTFVMTEELEGEEGEIDIFYTQTSHVTSQITRVDEDLNVTSSEVEVWNYTREDDGDIWYLAIEIDTDDGWTTFYEGQQLLDEE
jgi:hypothetical protein